MIYGHDIDVVDPQTIPPPGTLGFDRLGLAWPYNFCGLSYVQGMLHLQQDRPAPAARGYRAANRFAVTLRSALHAIGADDGETALLPREAETAPLHALARSDPREAVAPVQTLAAATTRSGAPESVAHLQRARRSAFTDLVTLGEYSAAAAAADPIGVLESDDGAVPDCATAFALCIFMLNHWADYPAAARWLSEASDLARARVADDNMFWAARFHLGLAQRYCGDAAAARAIGDTLRNPPSGLPPVPAALLARAAELS